ncbi:cation ABC transporter permease [candidate division TA06 bacterium DG_26]|uniref:Cation ABC transporter permease n=1 Tax=candidate division TA06 bacterium DG_26 TaxID=1703771 RepID=A0A0S7WM34_UNCT6|nr:MAG: cation ABC transporter permease [candidate division TA06 bacterium DG_26]
MLEVFTYQFMRNAILASIVGGASCGAVGAFVVMLRIPLVGVAVAHAAFAGAILGIVSGVNPLFGSVVFALLSASLIGPLGERTKLDANMSIGIIFAGVLGIAFLAMGFIEGPKSEVLRYIWGNILTVTQGDILLMAVVGVAVLLFVLLLFKEIQSVLFNREIAASVGIHEKPIYYGMLFAVGLVICLNLNTIGGLLIFSLIINPAAAAYQLTYRLRNMFLLSACFGIVVCLLGLSISYALNVPSGAVIIVVSSILLGITVILSPKRRVKFKGVLLEGRVRQ